MKNTILKLIADKPKHYSAIIKRTPIMLNWVQQNSLVQSSLADMIYSAVTQETNICPNGKIKKFKNITDGFIGCGPAARCKCTNDRVSTSVKRSKDAITIEQQTKTNDKRRATNIEKYGVSCSAQTEENKQKFREWYADPENVTKTLERIKLTNIKKYGVENCKSLPEVEQKIIATCLSRYGVENVSQIPSTKAKLRARTAEYKLSGHLLIKGYHKFSEYILNHYDFTLTTPIIEYAGTDSNQKLNFKCNVCNTEKISNFNYNRGLICETCHPKLPMFTSKEEQAVYDYITHELGIVNGKQGDKSLINPFELDMIFPDQKIAIEYCGLYWHSENSSGKNKKYHYEKMKATNKIGYRLITIFSDEWNLKRDIVKSKLRNIFKKTDIVYYARRLHIKLVDREESREFQNKYHLQGCSNSKIDVGLFSNNALVALMTFSNGRAALNQKTIEHEYELVRFLTNGSSVVGGASKLLKYFIKIYNPTKITSYSDNRWSEGNLYNVLGFEQNSEPTIGYWYVDDYKIRLHRYNFTKHLLVKEGNDSMKTEWEIMKDLGYDRIWDCGHQRFEMILSNNTTKIDLTSEKINN